MPWQDHFSRDELIARIRRLAEDHDLTHTQVAEVIGYELTGNMVAGMSNRAKPRIIFGAKRRKVTQARAAPKSQKGPTTKPLPVVREAAPAKPPRLAFVILDEVEGASPSTSCHHDDLRTGDKRCRFPLWPHRIGTHTRPERFERYFCGKPVVEGTSWCPECTKNLFTKSMARDVKPGEGRKADRTGRKAGWQYGT